ncbi:hypothetical protein FRC00_012870, partial [Tulasnella sp. 408]
ANAKAAKKRDELVAALDLLSSHLPSTFQSLSWALATNPKHLQATSSSATTEVDVVLVTGPTPTTVRSRCFIRLGDFSVSRYGERQQALSSTTTTALKTEPATVQGANSGADAQTHPSVGPPNPVAPPVEVEERAKEHDPEADKSFASFISDMSSALSSAAEENSEDEGSGDEEEEEEEEEDAEDSDASSSLASEDEEEEEEESEEDFDEEEEEEEASVVLEEDDTAAPTHSTASTSAPPQPSTEDEKNLRASVRTVSLALASNFDFGRDDIPVTQMNVLLRAPRCFQHPSWLPKQALGRTLDPRVDEFFSGAGPATGGVRKGPPEEGVLVRCDPSSEGVEGLPNAQSTKAAVEDEPQQADEGQHDMIWWQWSAGVIRGFGDI